MSVSLKPASSWRSGEPTGVRRGLAGSFAPRTMTEQAANSTATTTQARRFVLVSVVRSGRHPNCEFTPFRSTPVEPNASARRRQVVALAVGREPSAAHMPRERQPMASIASALRLA